MADKIDSKIYIEIINRIIEAQVTYYGPLAFHVARRVKGLELTELTEDKRVLRVERAYKDILNDLLQEFTKMGGSLSTNTIKSIILIFKNKYPNLDIDIDKLQ